MFVPQCMCVCVCVCVMCYVEDVFVPALREGFASRYMCYSCGLCFVDSDSDRVQLLIY